MLEDVVEVLVKKLPAEMQKDISTEIIVKTQEQLRLLEQKAPQKLIKKADTRELRAACVLEYICRKEAEKRLCQETLVKALGTKSKANFDKLHSLIGRYISVGPNLLPAATARTNPRRASTQPVPTRSEFEQQESIIPRLSIRLNSLIHDPNGFAVKAQTMFDDLLEYIDGLKGPRKDGQRIDIQRFKAAYEAASLYHVVSKTQTKKLSRMSKHKKGSNPQATAAAIRHDDDPTRILEISDILDASPDFTVEDFKHVVSHLETLITEMEELKAKNARKKKPTKRTLKKAKESGIKTKLTMTSLKGKKRAAVSKSTGNSLTSKKPKRNHAGIELEGNNAPCDSSDDDDDHNNDADDDEKRLADSMMEVDIPSLHEWQQQTLDKACQVAQTELEEKTDTITEEITRSMLLESAADAILSRFGLK